MLCEFQVYAYTYILFQLYFLCKILNVVQYTVGPCDYLSYIQSCACVNPTLKNLLSLQTDV